MMLNLLIPCCNALYGADFTGFSVLVYLYMVMVPSLRHGVWCFQTIILIAVSKMQEKMDSSRILAAVRQSGEYSEADHQDWVEQFIKGVSHLGISLEEWSILSLAFDIFHSRVKYVKLQVGYTRKIAKRRL